MAVALVAVLFRRREDYGTEHAIANGQSGTETDFETLDAPLRSRARMLMCKTLRFRFVRQQLILEFAKSTMMMMMMMTK